MCSISGHKIHGPKGIGVLYIDEHVKIKPIVFGGEQQKNVRSGTENVPGIAGIGLAAKMIYENLDEKVAAMRAMKEHFIEGVKQIPDTTIHGLYDETSAPTHYPVLDLRESEARFFYMRWKIKASMYPVVLHVLPTIRRSVAC